MTAELTTADVERYAKDFDADPARRLVQNAVTTTAVEQVALDRSVVTSMDTSMSVLLDDWSATNQKQSGRCWLFAGLNLLRVGAARTMGLKEFEFSQNHLMFWDKLEKANHWLEAVIATGDRDVDDRSVAHLLRTPAEDGGQWNMFVALVRKHGLVPKAVMPETHSSSKTSSMNKAIALILRRGARDLRVRVAAGDGADEVREAKQEILTVVHRVLAMHLGTPPERFTWQWTDKDKVFHRDEETTPQEFAARYAGLPLDEYVCLVHDPREENPVGRTYPVEHLGNVVGAPPSKAERLLHHQTLMTHAMLFTGVDVVDGRPRRWRVENSWGSDKADKGFWTMNDNWFGEHVFEIAVRRDALPASLLAAFEEEPVVLPAWDPMGALAG
jgi:bleomycin hydrolase